MTGTPLRIAIAKGRLWAPTLARFSAAGMAPLGEADRRLLLPTSLDGRGISRGEGR